jgi:hypothetical protein
MKNKTKRKRSSPGNSRKNVKTPTPKRQGPRLAVRQPDEHGTTKVISEVFIKIRRYMATKKTGNGNTKSGWIERIRRFIRRIKEGFLWFETYKSS